MPRVIVIGGANVDIKGRASGPCLPRTSNPGSVTLSAGGVGRNIAENLARLGLSVSLVTALGDDPNAALVRSACAGAGVDLSLAWVSGHPTGTYLAVLDETGEMVSAVSDMRAMDGLDPAHLDALSGELARADMLVADCNLPTGCLAWLMGFAGRHGLRLLIEPVSVAKARKLLGFTREAPVFAITPNAQQLDALADGDIARLHALGFANVVLHRGREGAVASDGHQRVAVPSVNSPEIADVTGAGDAAVAGLVFGILEGLPLAEAARLGQCAAAIKLGSHESVATDLSRDRLFRLAATA
jgi:pseudouridine kinase